MYVTGRIEEHWMIIRWRQHSIGLMYGTSLSGSLIFCLVHMYYTNKDMTTPYRVISSNVLPEARILFLINNPWHCIYCNPISVQLLQTEVPREWIPSLPVVFWLPISRDLPLPVVITASSMLKLNCLLHQPLLRRFIKWYVTIYLAYVTIYLAIIYCILPLSIIVGMT